MYSYRKPNYNETVFTAEELEDIKSMYLSKISSVKIGKKYNVGHKVILKALRSLGVEISQKKMVRKYDLNECYFKTIDTPEKAYILGFLYSDGSVSPSKSAVSLALQESDVAILEQIRSEIGSARPLEFLDYSQKNDFGYHYLNQYRLVVYSAEMCSDLIDKGVVPSKSLKITFPEWMPSELVPHFVRGVYDGDGSIYRQIKSVSNQAVTVTITATENFCQSLKTICKDALGVKAGIYDASCHNGVTKVFTLSGRWVSKKFLDWIYKDATMYLQRKYDRYVEYYDINSPLSA